MARWAGGRCGSRTVARLRRDSMSAVVTRMTWWPASARVSATAGSRTSPNRTCTVSPADSMEPCRYWRVPRPVAGTRATSRNSRAAASADPTDGPAPTKSAARASAKTGASAVTGSVSRCSASANAAARVCQPGSAPPWSQASARMPRAATVAV